MRGPAIDIDRIARAIDPRKLGPRGIAQLVETVDLLTRADSGVGLGDIQTSTLVRLLARASPTQLDAVAESPTARRLVLSEVFRRMSVHLRTDRAATVSAVVLWRIGCKVKESEYEPFQTGTVGMVRLFATRRLKVRGDLRFAVRLGGLFDIPAS